MEPPIVPMSPRNRLVRDYSSDEDVARVRNVGDGRPRGYDVDAPTYTQIGIFPDLHTNNSSRATALRARSPEREEHPRITIQSPTQPYQDGASEHRPAKPPDDLRKLDFNLEPIDENIQDASEYEPSVSSVSRVSERTGISGSSGSRLADFFAGEVIQVVLHNPTTAHALLKFSQTRLCGENMEFLEKVDRYHTLLNEVAKTMFEIHKEFISSSAPNQINIPQPILTKLNKDLKTSLSSTLPKLESVFVDSQTDIERLVSMDIYPRFVRHQMTMSAPQALAGDRNKYAGLGDCFILTDPARADNPIVFASDGFVKVTGYTRNEIIPRNCRFLQFQHTDRTAIKRLKDAIGKREESVELILNQKKNGEPFWNLLYTTPLFDARGNVVFFLGGQINCSTTVHSASDILRVLAQSSDTDEDKTNGLISPTEQKQSTRSSRIFSAFRSNSKPALQLQEPGMEKKVLDKIEILNLKKQMATFYTAYSKVTYPPPLRLVLRVS